MKNIFQVGKFRLGWRWVRLEVDNSRNGGKATFVPDDEISVITIGIKQEWGDALGTLLHEAQEISYWDLHSHWHRRNDFCRDDSDRALFVVSHADFTEACSRVGWFMSKAVPQFSAAYKKHFKKDA